MSSQIIEAVSSKPSKQAYVGDLSSAQRMATLDRLNKLAGYSAAKTILPEGTALWDIGEQNLARHKADINSLPTLAEFCRVFHAQQEARQMLDIVGNFAQMRMREDGRIYRILQDGKAGGAIGYTPTGMVQLVQLYSEHLGMPSGMAKSLMFLSPKACSVAFNDLAIRADEKGMKGHLPDRVFRTAVNVHGQRYLRAVTSTHHVGIRGGYDAIVLQLAKLWPDARARAVFTEDRFDIDVIFPMHSREIRVGDVLHGTISLTLSETKDVAASVRDALLRVLCANLTVRSYGKEAVFTRRHVGPANFIREIAGRLRDGWNRLAPFVEAFGDSYADLFPSTLHTRAEVVERTYKVFKDELKALSAESVIAAWDMDGKRGAGNSRAGLVNALTRASQTLGVEAAEEVESVAGRFVEEGWSALS